MTGATRRAGFTLIEILVVLAIVSILFAMGFASLGDQRRASEVQAEAERLASVLRLTRNRAINEQTAYGVAFNIRNGMGSSGAVLNNWDGGHYYRVIGPHRTYREPPVPRGGHTECFPDFADFVKECWVSEPYQLPTRNVRFLALGDLDRGPRMHGSSGWPERYFDVDATYPRPWFGVYDEATGTLWPWGGYDPGKDHSGFSYEGADGDITGCVHPSDRTYNHDFNNDKAFANHDHNADGDSDDPREREVDYTIWRQGEGRALVDANWLDAAIFFTPTGEALFLEWNLGRRLYKDEQTDPNVNTKRGRRNGLSDRCLQAGPGVSGLDKNGNYAMAFNTSAVAHARSRAHPESQHFLAHTGGWHLTLAPDATTDGNRFTTVDEALDSITPAWRVYVGATGAIRVFRVQRRRSGSLLDGRTIWPPAPGDWQDNTLMRSVHQVGWLHEPGTAGWPNNPVPMGEPILDKVTGRMLTERIWWFND